MTLKDARALQREIRDRYNYHCIVPLGFGPAGYFARIFGETPIDFHDRASFRKYRADSLRRHRATMRAYDAALRRRPPRSPIDLMIDRACGLA